MWKPPLRCPRSHRLATNSATPPVVCVSASYPLCNPGATTTTKTPRRYFHDYFVTHLPSSSLHPDSGPSHKLPRENASPHDPKAGSARSPAHPPMVGVSRDMTVVRIPLKSAKHHFGASWSRGQRPYNEDAYQAGTIEIPAFAKRRPLSLTRNARKDEVVGGDSASGDPQVFYFGVFDGHGGAECSEWLRENLHRYVEGAAGEFQIKSTLQRKKGEVTRFGQSSLDDGDKGAAPATVKEADKQALDAVDIKSGAEVDAAIAPPKEEGGDVEVQKAPQVEGDTPVVQSNDIRLAEDLERALMKQWKELVGGYFRRFKPEFFSINAGGQGHILEQEAVLAKQTSNSTPTKKDDDSPAEGVGIESILTYAFLKADYDFVKAQVNKDENKSQSGRNADAPLNQHEILGKPSRLNHPVGASSPTRFLGGSTCSIALISTPTPMPYWHPASPSTLVTAHVGDTRILLCSTQTGEALSTTSTHHPSHPKEAERMRRYAASFVTDSFGEERVQGLANTRAFGDIRSKRIGVSAEPEITLLHIAPAAYSFMVLVSDGVSGVLSDQEIVDIVKEARTPEQGARDVTGFATEVGVGDAGGDNCTCLVVRMGGWERRIEGGGGSMRTKEMRDYRRREASDPRSNRT